MRNIRNEADCAYMLLRGYRYAVVSRVGDVISRHRTYEAANTACPRDWKWRVVEIAEAQSHWRAPAPATEPDHLNEG